MKQLAAVFTIFLMGLSIAGAALAQSDGHSGHGGMQMGGAMIMLGTVTTDGITAMAHLQDLRQGKAGHTPSKTHNFMVGFESDGKGGAVTQGRVAVKVTTPDGQTGSPVTLNLKDGFFRADLELKVPGPYGFEVGSKLADGKVRQFHFTVELK